MRILCDHNAASKYVRAFSQESWISVRTVRSELSVDASDAEIASYAAANEWVVFTTDDDFYHPDVRHGLLVYSQIEDPRPGTVVDAIASIAGAYASADEIVEFVPDGWA